MIYEKSAYSYSKKCIFTLIISLGIFGLTLLIGIIYLTNSENIDYRDNDFPNLCASTIGGYFYLGGMIDILLFFIHLKYIHIDIFAYSHTHNNNNIYI